MKSSKLQNTAILIFANSAEEEIRHKSLAHARDLFTDLTYNTLKKVRQTGIPYFHFSEHEQRGIGFGERFTNAIQDIFDKGFENIITLGNDTPQLKTSQLIQALNLLESGKIVVGPSADGGFYLMGINQSSFNSEQFIRLPWRTADVRSALVSLMVEYGRDIHSLQVLEDIDSLNDIKRIASRIYNIPISIKCYLQLLHKSLVSTVIRKEAYSFSLAFAHYNKGSPF